MPTKCRPCSRSASSRRRVSSKWALPPSTMMSPSSSSGTSSSMTASVGSPALTMMMIAARLLQRGDEVLPWTRCGTKSPSSPCSATRASVLRAGAVVHGDGVAVPGEVAGEVAAHDREAGDTDGGEVRHEDSLRGEDTTVCRVARGGKGAVATALSRPRPGLGRRRYAVAAAAPEGFSAPAVVRRPCASGGAARRRRPWAGGRG